MSTIAEALTAIEAELQAVRTRADQLEAARAALQRILTPVAAPPRPAAPAAVGPPTVAHAPTTRRATPAGGPGRHDEAILAALRRAGSPMTPKALGAAVSLPVPSLRRVLGDLARRRLVVVTGATATRRVALSGRPTKEGL